MGNSKFAELKTRERKKREKYFIYFKINCLNISNKEMEYVVEEGTYIIKMKSLKYLGIKSTRNMRFKNRAKSVLLMEDETIAHETIHK